MCDSPAHIEAWFQLTLFSLHKQSYVAGAYDISYALHCTVCICIAQCVSVKVRLLIVHRSWLTHTQVNFAGQTLGQNIFTAKNYHLTQTCAQPINECFSLKNIGQFLGPKQEMWLQDRKLLHACGLKSFSCTPSRVSPRPMSAIFHSWCTVKSRLIDHEEQASSGFP